MPSFLKKEKRKESTKNVAKQTSPCVQYVVRRAVALIFRYAPTTLPVGTLLRERERDGSVLSKDRDEASNYRKALVPTCHVLDHLLSFWSLA